MNWTAFIDGAARVFDLFGTMSAPVDLPATDEEAMRRDLQAIASDWQAVTAAPDSPQDGWFIVSTAPIKSSSDTIAGTERQ